MAISRRACKHAAAATPPLGSNRTLDPFTVRKDHTMKPKLVNLTWVFALLSILAVGGGTAVLARDALHDGRAFPWISNKQFSRHLTSLGQVRARSEHADGDGDRLSARRPRRGRRGRRTGLPLSRTCILTFYVNRLWNRFLPARHGAGVKANWPRKAKPVAESATGAKPAALNRPRRHGESRQNRSPQRFQIEGFFSDASGIKKGQSDDRGAGPRAGPGSR